MKKDLEAFKQTISSKDKERDSKIKTLENENARLKGQVTQLQGTVQNATKEISSLTNSVTDLKREKADQNKVASLEQQVNSNSDALKNALSISTVVTKLQSEMKESKSIWDDVKRLRKDMNTTTDPRKRIFPTPAVDANANGRVEVLQKSVDALTQRIENQPAPSNFSNLQKDFEKMKKDSEKLKEEFKKAKDESSKVLDRHEKEIERHDECIDRHERDLRADNNRINEVNQDLSNLRDDLTKLNKKVREIDLDLEDLEWEVKKLPRANFDASEKMEGEVKNKQAEFAKIRDTVLRHDEDIKSLNAKVAKIPEKSTPDNSAALSVRLDHVEAKQDTQQNSINTAAQKIKTLEKDTKNHKNTMDDIKRKSDQKHTSLSKVVDGLQKRVNTIDDEQSALQEKVDSIDTTLERAADTEGLQRDVALLKSNHEAHTASIKNLDRILHGAEVMTNSESASLVQQLIDLKSTVHAMGQSYENQPRSNSAPAQQSGSAQQTSSPRLGVLEKRVTQVERDHASMKKDIGALRIDIDGFEEAVAQQSELIEEDVKQRVRHEVATAMSSAHQPAPQTPENVKHMIEESTGRIRNEMQELRQDVARRSATPRVQEVEDAIYSRLEQSASRVVDNKLDDLNKKLDGSYERYNLLSDHLAALSKLLEQRCPPGYSDILADLVMFSETQGRPSNFFWATITAIRDLQSRFDNLQTRELAVCILNGLMPHINQKLVQPLSQTLLEPIRNSIAANIGNEFKGDVKDVRANVELVKRKIRDIESSSKQKFDDLDRRVNTQTPASDTAVQDELRRLSQESHRSCAVINERIDKEIRTATDGIRNLWTTVNALSADYERDKPVIWEQLREHRDNIERAQEDFGGIQVCVCRLAKKVDPNLVPHSWFEMYET
ncbi:Myosin-2 heavy chain [Lasiodiplodia theobromae]|uniref:Myosin-2 heavy chain n=1 Tax=Lasiodiplodia theobromae TaxID=45133 RepID=A0A5N5D6S1_9PEZI|nr:Myosin-2 heavy chain [Lasiodiplodia theobromae]